jgi:hypothetical protein
VELAVWEPAGYPVGPADRQRGFAYAGTADDEHWGSCGRGPVSGIHVAGVRVVVVHEECVKCPQIRDASEEAGHSWR